MTYLFQNTSTEPTRDKTSHTVKYYKHTSAFDKAIFQNRCGI